ncbi:hypothetical protein LR48_Vigan02g081400 [Vigna angularis]|uniref:Uncharacterized protein n=1 Tax=Phaseolus angularis TaxID=3914 RepID=A0A0L9TWV7_PHAAN|nr:hypothetical protein LR48_Vigan02g081400 [Vigna angularis]
MMRLDIEAFVLVILAFVLGERSVMMRLDIEAFVQIGFVQVLLTLVQVVRPNSVRPRAFGARPLSVRPEMIFSVVFSLIPRGLTRVVGVVGGPRVDAITGGLFRGNGLALCMVGWNPSAMALQSSRGHHKCTTRPSSTYILCPDVSRVLT